MLGLRDKVAVVTGATGNLGSAVCGFLVDQGAAVIGVDRALPSSQLKRDFWQGPRRAFVLGDVTDRESLLNVLSVSRESFGTPNVLLNFAGVDSPPDSTTRANGPFEEAPVDAALAFLDVNFIGTFLACQVFGSEMAKGLGGSIVNVASLYASLAPDQSLYEYRRAQGEQFFKPAAYGASKAAVLSLTRYLAAYWAQQGVRVNAISPGGIFAGQDPEFVAAYVAKTPMRRMAETQDLYGPILFLTDDQSRYVTGQEIIVDGGFSIV